MEPCGRAFGDRNDEIADWALREADDLLRGDLR
jgi:hypothetical protein